MKKLLLLTGLLVCAIFSFAQVNQQDRSNAMQLVSANKLALGFSSEDLNNVIVSSTYKISGTNVTMVYLQQSYRGIPVYNQIKTLAFRDGKVVSDAGAFIPSMEKFTRGASELPSVTAESAVQAAFTESKTTAKAPIAALTSSNDGKKVEFGKLSSSDYNINAELIWVPAGKENYKLAWQVFLAPNPTSDMWLIRVDAKSNQIISKDNLTITCRWDNEKHSIEEHFEQHHGNMGGKAQVNYIMEKDKNQHWQYRPFTITSATYRVVKYPAESPIHTGGVPVLATDPWTLAGGNATSMKWHSNPTDQNNTVGNNVVAQEDRDGNNGTGIRGGSSTALPNLTFDYAYDFTKSPTDVTSDNQQAAIVNLFYWNNIIHDYSYIYGFDEVGGNFQTDNQGRGGAGNDHVFADAQDGSGTNNANFSTPADGGSPRMQMFLWNQTTPGRDGDMDASVILHEYTHGISNRLTGGPANVSCLGNSEQGGEGWSDYFALMGTTNWATTTINDGPLKRGIGNYVLGLPVTGTGIRTAPYSTDMSIYSKTYANLPAAVVPHGVGEIWCMMLWEMTWEIIKQDGAINPNLFNPGPTASMIGNAAALKLVTEGMRLQVCSPGFVDGRNAILQADQVFFGGKYNCAIWKAFAKRGLGRNASQGSSASSTDGIADFTVDAGTFGFAPNLPVVLEGNNLIYTTAITAGQCTPMTNFVLRDTLPTSVTYVSGGSYNAGTRVVTFSPVNLAVNASANFVTTVTVNNGTYFAPVDHVNDAGNAIAPNFAATSTSANVWSVAASSFRSAPTSFFSPDAALVSDQILTTTGNFAIPTGAAAFSSLSFWHRYNTESTFDGAVVEYSVNNGGNWNDLGPYLRGNTYNGTISTLWSSPIGGRNAFTGNSGTSFIQTTADLSAFAGQNIKFRFRMASDISVAGTGWWVDDILVQSGPFVYVKSGLYDAGNIRVSYKDSLTPIIPTLTCVDPSITTQPSSVVRCSTAGNGVFTVVAAGTSLSYQWESSTDGGTVWTPIVGATAATYTVTNPTSATNGTLYRVVITGACGTPVTSQASIIYVSPAITHSGVSATPNTSCAPGATVITGTANGGTVGAGGLVASTGTVNLVIPDNSAAGVNSAVTLPTLSIQQAANLQIRLNIDHTFVGDLVVKLTSPCGTTFVFDRPGVPASGNGNSGNLAGVYIFDIANATVIPEAGGGTIATGTYAPSDAAGAAHNWAGLTFPCTAAGTWTLNVSDNASLDNGILHDWGIILGGTFTHTLTGPGTIINNGATGTNGSVANYSVSNIPGGNQTYVLTSTDAMGCSVSTNIAVTINGAPNITTQPTDKVICAGQNTTFTVATNSPLTPTYQWQINQGSGFVNLANVAPFSGVTTATLTLTNVSTVYNSNQFRVIVTTPCASNTSNVALLTVNPTPVLNVGPSGQCAPVTLIATGANTYTWSPATGLNTTTGGTVIANPTTTTVYTVTGTLTAGGCSSTASVTVLGTPPTPVITPAAPVICAGSFVALSVPSSLATFTTSGVFNIPAGQPGNTAAGPASPYPSTISVSGLPTSGVIVKSITINGITHTFPNDIDVLVQSPTGTNMVVMSDVGGTTLLNNVSYTFDDSAPTTMTTGVNPAGTYKPTNSGAADTWVAPGPGAINQATPLLSNFTGNPNGTWNVFIVDDAGGDVGTINSVTITFVVNTAQWTPIAGLYLDANGVTPYSAGTFANTVYASPASTTTYTVTSTLGTCAAATPGTVTVTVNPKPTIAVSPTGQCGPVALTATGNSNTYSWSPAGGLSATTGATVTANPTLNTTYTVTGTITATGCTNTATAVVNATPATPVVTPASIAICQGASTMLTVTSTPATATYSGAVINVPLTAGTASVYPATINVGGLPVNGARVKSVTINGITHTFPVDLDILLQAPTNTNVVLMSDVGGTGAISNVNYTFDDSAPTSMTAAAAPAGTYKPSNVTSPDTWVAPGPGSVDQPNPTLSSFTGNLNGNWNLYVVDDANLDGGSITSWSITFEIPGAVWTPATGLFTDPGTTVPYVAGTYAGVVYAKPTTTTTYAVTRASATCTSATTNVTVTVYNPITITTQPATQTVCEGANVTFSVVTTGNFQSYQWQISTNGGTTWGNIVNANNSSLVLPNVATTLSGNQYRVIVTNTCSTVTSNAATLTVNAKPVVTVAALPTKICLSDTLVALSGLPTGGFWTGIGTSGNYFVPTSTAVGTYTLTYSYSSPAGCVNTASVIAKVEDCPERLILLRDNAVILWPNPNNGRFNIRINSTLYNYLGMRVYTSAGQLVRVQNFGGLVFGRTIPVDLTNLPSAVYMVKFYYNDGVRTSEKTFKVVVGR
jgi:subtilisin-like proprotein convertase family protein